MIGIFCLVSVNYAGEPGTISEEAHLKMHLSMEKVSGDNQETCNRKPLSEPFVVRVVDKNGNGVSGVPITFKNTNTSGLIITNGSLSATEVTTNFSGKAQTTLTFGDKAGQYIVQAIADTSDVESGSPQSFSAEAKGEDWPNSGPAVEYTMPAKFKDTINKITTRIGVNIQESKFSLSSKQRDCCMVNNGVITSIEDGEIQGDGTLSFKIGGKDLQTPWALPTIEKLFDFGVAEIEVLFEVGLYWDFAVNLAGTGGRRVNLCDDQECFYGALGLNFGAGIGPKFEAVVCTDTIWTRKDCTGILIRPLYISAAIKGTVGWDQSYCGLG
ncbi:MAG: hypothetical protein OMM_11176, partial [Candidatus Magnetoglobus multicellularis str. Araruama]